MISYWGVDHGDEVSKVFKKPTFGGGRMTPRQGFDKGFQAGQSARRAVNQGARQIGAAGAYTMGRFKAAPMKKKIGYGAAGAAGVGGVGYSTHRYRSGQ